jgi:hypothetical protein
MKTIKFFAGIFLCFLFTFTKAAIIWSPNLMFGESIYPSYAVANSVFQDNSAKKINKIKGDAKGQIGISVDNLSFKPFNLKVKIVCNDILNTTEESIYVDSKSQKFYFYPKLDYKWDALRKNSQTKPVNIKITVWIDGKLLGTKLKIASLQSINNCPYTCISQTNDLLDLNYMYAAYVNEDNDLLNNVLLKEMLNQKAIDKIYGYQSGDVQEVRKQVFAVWNMLQKRGISYSSLSASKIQKQESLPIVYHQFVRTFEDALESRQANCVDGTVMMASILYRMGIQPVIVTTPSHCFLGYALDRNQTSIEFLETTALGSEVSAEDASFAEKQDFYDAKLGADFGMAYKSFVVATLLGRITYNENADKFNNYTFYTTLSIIDENNINDVVDALQYQIFPVEKYKRKGLQTVFK